MTNCPLVITIGLTTNPGFMLNVIVLPGQASIIAWRRLPGPLSALFVTIGSVIQQFIAADSTTGFPI